MKKSFFAGRISALVAAAVMAVCVCACSSSSSSFSIVSSLDNKVKITSENSDTDTDGTGSIVVDEGEALVVESAITSGAMTIRLYGSGKSAEGEADWEQEFTGTATEEFLLPGADEYSVSCMVTGDGTSGTLSLYTKEAETEAEEAAAESEDAGGTGEAEAAPGEEDLLQEAAYAIDESLEEVWGANRHVSYTTETNTIYINLWDEGVDSETIGSIENWDELKADKMQMFEAYNTAFDQAGIEDGHLVLQYISDSEDLCFLAIEDGEITYDVFAEGGDADADAGADEASDEEQGGFLALSTEEQIAAIADYMECDPDCIAYVDTGMLDDENEANMFAMYDPEGNELDLRLLLLDDGTLYGYTPEQELVDPRIYLGLD